MSKFKAKNCITITIPESFRKDLQDLCNEVEDDSIGANLDDVINLILEASPTATSWTNFNESLVINFIEEE